MNATDLCRPLTAALFLCVALRSEAYFPEPGNIYYGIVRGADGRQLGADDRVRLFMRTSTNTVAACDVITAPAGRPNFVLRPALDDGTLNRYSPLAVRQGEALRVFYVQQGITNELSGTVPAVGSRGAIRSVALTVPVVDVDGDGLADEWEIRWFGNLAATDGTSDFDGDGCDERCEYENGRNPLEPDAEELVLTLVAPGQPNSLTVEWRRLPGKSYSLEGAPVLGGPFLPLSAALLTGDPNGTGPVQVNVSTNKTFFIRAREQ
jgi:hypothetical protein